MQVAAALFFNPDSKELRFNVSGENGTMGYVTVYIPKSLINDISSLKVQLDDNQIEYTAQSQSDGWLLHFTYHHSTHMVIINLSSSTGLNENIENWMVYGVVVTIAVVFIVAILLPERRKKEPINFELALT